MRHRRLAIRAFVFASPFVLAAIAVVALLPGCARKPDAPIWSNPFDPVNSDPIHVRLTLGNDLVTVRWSKPDFPDIAAYEIWRSLDGVDFAFLDEAGAGKTSYTDIACLPNRRNYYKVVVRNAAGSISSLSRAVPASIVTYPSLGIERGAATTPTRHVTLFIVTAVGDSLEIAAAPGFTDAMHLAASTTDTNRVTWDLGSAAANGEFKHVYLRVRTGSEFSLVAHDSVETSLAPDLQIAGSPGTLASRRPTLEIMGAAGATRMRFATSQDGLPTAAWVSPDSTTPAGAAYWTSPDDLLGPETTTQTLYGEFESDFGYVVTDDLACTPDNLAAACFQLARGATVTDTRIVPIGSLAIATQMRFHEDPDSLAVTPWQAYADTVLFTLSPYVPYQSTLKRVYGQYANDWFSTVVSDTVRLISPPPPTRSTR